MLLQDCGVWIFIQILAENLCQNDRLMDVARVDQELLSIRENEFAESALVQLLILAMVDQTRR
jgi:hypothetical protein